MREESSFGGDLLQLTALYLERDKTPLISSESVLSQRHRSSCNLIHVLVRTTLDDIRLVQSRSHKELLISGPSRRSRCVYSPLSN